LCGDSGGAAAHKWIKDDAAGWAGCLDHAFDNF
jgi:hypothetical protein